MRVKKTMFRHRVHAYLGKHAFVGFFAFFDLFGHMQRFVSEHSFTKQSMTI